MVMWSKGPWMRTHPPPVPVMGKSFPSLSFRSAALSPSATGRRKAVKHMSICFWPGAVRPR